MNSAKEKLFWSEFLDLYESMPCLWKIKSKDYLNRILKVECYNKMVEKLREIDPEANREKVVKKINSFRTNYKRDLKKIKKSEKSGAGCEDLFESSLWYFDKLNFLEEQECTREGICTMDEDLTDERQSENCRQPKKKKKNEEDELLRAACSKLNEPETPASVMAKTWATQYAELSSTQQIFARTIFSDVLFSGCLEKLNEKMVEDVHKVLKGQAPRRFRSRSSTPYVDEYSSSNTVVSSPPQEYAHHPLIISNELISTDAVQGGGIQIAQYYTTFLNE